MPFTHTISPVWLEKIVFTKSRLKFVRPAGNHCLWGTQVNCGCKRCCSSGKIVFPLTYMFFKFKALYTITTRCHMVALGQMASHTPKPLSLRAFKFLVRGSWFFVLSFWFLFTIFYFLIPLSYFLVPVLKLQEAYQILTI